MSRSVGDTRTTRRRVLSTVGASGSVGVAGCNDGTQQPSPNRMSPENGAETVSESHQPGTSTRAETVVTDGSKLQSALESSPVVRVSGEVTVPETVSVPVKTTLYGYGVHQEEISGDGITGEIAGPILDIKSHSQVFGLAVGNTHPEGIGIGMSGWVNEIYRTDVHAGSDGIAEVTGGEHRVESRISFNRITVNTLGEDDPVMGDHGINTGKYTDCEIHNNIVRGFQTGIRVNNAACTVSNNHPYPHPGDKGTTEYGVLLDENANGCRVKDNWIDNFSAAGIEDRNGKSNIHRDNWMWLYPSDLSDDVYGINITNGLANSIVDGNRAWVNAENGTGTQPIAIQGETTDSRVGNTFYYDNFELEAVSTEWRGRHSKSGDGSTRTFQLAHNCLQAPDHAHVSAVSADAAGTHWIGEINADVLTVHYAEAPPEGTENLVWNVTIGTK